MEKIYVPIRGDVLVNEEMWEVHIPNIPTNMHLLNTLGYLTNNSNSVVHVFPAQTTFKVEAISISKGFFRLKLDNKTMTLPIHMVNNCLFAVNQPVLPLELPIIYFCDERNVDDSRTYKYLFPGKEIATFNVHIVDTYIKKKHWLTGKITRERTNSEWQYKDGPLQGRKFDNILNYISEVEDIPFERIYREYKFLQKAL